MIRGESAWRREKENKCEKERVMEREKKETTSWQNDTGSDAKLNCHSSGGNDMKPVIYRGFGGRDQMTNYTILWSLKQCTLGSSTLITQLKCIEQTQLLLWFPFQTQQVVGKCVCVCFYVCGWTGNSSGFMFCFLIKLSPPAGIKCRIKALWS